MTKSLKNLSFQTMENPSVTLTHEDYTVGWICTLTEEKIAAKAMLDELHVTIPRLKNDNNLYVLGKIGKHNVAITRLVNYGLVSAAKASTMMQFSFPSLRFGLMVGTGGGVPSAAVDIRLGDVVVSAPTGKEPGVVHYGLGKAEKEGDFQRKGTLNKPDILLLGAA
jgi:hypothetical protein